MTRLAIGAPLLRLRSDEQLVALFRSGNDDAFRVIYERYRRRLFAYTRQMLTASRQDAEDALQDVFVRAYDGLRANDRGLALRSWLYRIAHNRCIDELRRPAPPAPEVLELVRAPVREPFEEAEQRESLRRLVQDLRRLPEQQRSALLMRELGGMSYAEVAAALGVTIPALKSLLVRARDGLIKATEARDTACTSIRRELTVAHDRGVRPTGMARRHMRDCTECREFRGELRGTSRQLGALVPVLGPLGAGAKLLSLGSGSGGGISAGGGAAAGGGAVAAGGILGGGAVFAGAGHIAAVLTATMVAAGGVVEISHKITPPAHHVQPHLAAPSAVRAGATPAPRSSLHRGHGLAFAGRPAEVRAVSPAVAVIQHHDGASAIGRGEGLPQQPTVPFQNPTVSGSTGPGSGGGASSGSDGRGGDTSGGSGTGSGAAGGAADGGPSAAGGGSGTAYPATGAPTGSDGDGGSPPGQGRSSGAGGPTVGSAAGGGSGTAAGGGAGSPVDGG